MAVERRQRGFSLLEAIVALTILATAGLALFAAMSQTVQMVMRAEAVRESDSALRNALAWMETVNPALDPRGQQQLGEWTLRWESELVEPARDATTGTLQVGLYKIGLYRIGLELQREGQPVVEAELQRAGYEQVRQPVQL